MALFVAVFFLILDKRSCENVFSAIFSKLY
jgi:hypothetical protein